MMDRRHRAQLAVYKAILGPHGYVCRFETGGKHCKVAILAPDGSRLVRSITDCGLTDDHNVRSFARQQARAILRSAGLVDQAQGHDGRRTHHRRIHGRPAALPAPEAFRRHPSRDPWAVLASLVLTDRTVVG